MKKNIAFIIMIFVILLIPIISNAEDLDTKKILKGSEAQEYAAMNNIPLTRNNIKLYEITVVDSEDSNSVPSNSIFGTSNYTAQGVVKTKVYTKQTSTSFIGGREVLDSAEGYGPIRLTVTVSQSVSATFSSTIGINAEVVSTGMGFSVTKTYTVADSGIIDVPAKKYGLLEAHTKYKVYNFDIMQGYLIGEDKKIGTGQALKPSGVIFASYME